jgi:FkbM family methyltransferase
MNLSNIINQAVSVSACRLDDVLKIMHASIGAPKYAIGKNNDTLNVLRVYGVSGVIDDFSVPGEEWGGIALVNSSDIPKNSLIINCSTSISPVDVLLNLRCKGFNNIINLYELVMASDGSLAWPWFVEAQRAELREFIGDWQHIYNALADDISRKTFLDVVRYRVSANPLFMKDYKVRMSDQYFEDFMRYKEEVFVDAGGFDGDTAEMFLSRYPDYKKIYVFEPSIPNMQKARQRLSKYKNIEFRASGLSEFAGRVPFNHNGGSSSTISTSAGGEIELVALDEVVQDRISVIKMDIEGGEMGALKGARNHLKSHKIKLALAAYHKESDIRLFYQFMMGFGHDYKIFLRHYTQGWSETVLYFV